MGLYLIWLFYVKVMGLQSHKILRNFDLGDDDLCLVFTI